MPTHWPPWPENTKPILGLSLQEIFVARISGSIFPSAKCAQAVGDFTRGAANDGQHVGITAPPCERREREVLQTKIGRVEEMGVFDAQDAPVRHAASHSACTRW